MSTKTFDDYKKKILIGNKILEYLKTGDKLYRKKEYKGAIINYTKAIELDELCEQAYRRRRLARIKINDEEWRDDEEKLVNIGAYGELKEPGFFKEFIIGFFEDIIKGLNKIDSFFSDDEYIHSNERKSTYNSDIKERKTKKSDVGFIEHWKKCVYDDFFDLDGRVSREEYLNFIFVFILGTLIISFPLYYITSASAIEGAFIARFLAIPTLIIFSIWSLLNCLGLFHVTVRRLNDTGRSPFWIILFWLPLGIIYLIYLIMKPSIKDK